MKLSQYPLHTLRDDPKDETSVNARLLIRAGFIDKLMSGVFSYLPLGLKVLQNIENIVREEMNKLSAQEVSLPALHPAEPWKTTGRWDVKEMIKTDDYGLGWTHEEIITPLVKKMATSEKDFPIRFYQIQTKFRNEPRAKSGLLRGREFTMKDLYSFHLSQEDLDIFYDQVKEAYLRIFHRFGIGQETFLTLAPGGTFSKTSHEFQTASPYGEDNILVCLNCRLGVNQELGINECPQCGSRELDEIKTVETGNIFKLGDRFSSAFDFKVNNKKVYMGCYGLGTTRAVGAIAEVLSDDRGLVWPTSVAPFHVYLIAIQDEETAEKIYQQLDSVIYDDRDKAVGEKFNDADLLGIPYRLIVSHRQPGMVEVKKRTESEGKMLKIEEAIKYVQENIKQDLI